MPPRLWIVPKNDLESLEILRILQQQGEDLFVTAQPWGAAWSGLDPQIVTSIQERRKADPNLTVYGIELSGEEARFAVTNIDHHRYSHEDRSHPESSLEQVARILDIPLSREQRLIAANDREWIPGLKREKASLAEIEDIRLRDRRAQGLTEHDDEQASEEVEKATLKADGVTEIETAGRPSSAHFDFAWKRGAREILVRGPEQWMYSGPKSRILASLKLPESTFQGGGFEHGYFGIVRPSDDSKEKLDKVLARSGGDGARVQHLDIVLHWPFRIQPLGRLKEARGNSTKPPQDYLDAYSKWVEGQGKWKERKAEDLSSRQAFSEFVYFHPFVQDLLFPRQSDNGPVMRVLERTDVEALHIDVRYDTSSQRDRALKLDLQVDGVRLHLLTTDVAILTVRAHIAQDLSIDRALDLLNQVRRVYVPYWGDRLCGTTAGPAEELRSPGQTPLRAWWVFQGGVKSQKSECAKVNKLTSFVQTNRRPPVLDHWRDLLLPFGPLEGEETGSAAAAPDRLLVQQLGDERMFLAAAVILNDPQRLSEEQWMRLAFVDEGGGGWAYSKDFLRETQAQKRHFYDRFWHWNTRYLVTGYSFLQVMANNAFSFDVLRGHLQRQYSDLCLLALIQKFSILTLRHRLAGALLHYHETSGAKERIKFHRELQWLSNDYASFMALYDFGEVSNQLQAAELFEKLREHLHIERLETELEGQLRFAAEVEKANHSEWIQERVNFWIPATLAFGFLGLSMGWGNVEASLTALFDKRTSVLPDWPHALADLAGLVLLPVGAFLLFKWLSGPVADRWLASKTNKKP